MMERYGVKYPGNSPIIRERKIQTNLKKYGVKCPLELKHIQEMSKKTKIEKYGKSMRDMDKFKRTCLQKYGTTNPLLKNAKRRSKDLESILILWPK